MRPVASNQARSLHDRLTEAEGGRWDHQPTRGQYGSAPGAAPAAPAHDHTARGEHQGCGADQWGGRGPQDTGGEAEQFHGQIDRRQVGRVRVTDRILDEDPEEGRERDEGQYTSPQHGDGFPAAVGLGSQQRDGEEDEHEYERVGMQQPEHDEENGQSKRGGPAPHRAVGDPAEDGRGGDQHGERVRPRLLAVARGGGQQHEEQRRQHPGRWRTEPAGQGREDGQRCGRRQDRRQPEPEFRGRYLGPEVDQQVEGFQRRVEGPAPPHLVQGAADDHRRGGLVSGPGRSPGAGEQQRQPGQGEDGQRGPRGGRPCRRGWSTRRHATSAPAGLAWRDTQSLRTALLTAAGAVSAAN